MELYFYILAHIINGMIAVYLGIFVYFKDRKKSINRTFFMLTMGVALWSLSYGIWLLSKDPQVALFWSRTLNLGATLIPVLTLHWVINFLKLKKKKILIFFYCLTLFFVLFSYSKFYIYGTKQIFQFPYWPQLNWLYILFLIFGWVTILFYCFGLLLKEYGKARGIFKEQIRYVFLGMIIGYIGGSTNYPLMFGLSWFPPLGSPLVIAFPLFFAYAMVKHRLMDIKFVLRKYSVFIASLVSIYIPALVIKYVLNNYLAYTQIWIDFAILIGAISVFSPVKNYYYYIANKYFFSSLYDAQTVISGLSENLKSTLEIERIYGFISDTIVNSFHTKTVTVLIFNEKTKNYEVSFDVGHEVMIKKEFMEDKGFYTGVIRNNPTIVVEELKRAQYVKFKQTFDLFDSFGMDILVPLNVKDKVIGLLALGQKESRDMYNEEDLRVLAIIGAQSGIALENAMLFEETRQFGIKLEKEVEKATAELRSANKKLKKLDEAKSEFVSIASHQLRTPLTIIKGFISMILEGNFGPIAPKQADPLNKVFESNERLIKMVENLLNVSRIESGRIWVHYQKASMENLVGDIVNELKRTAAKKGLELIYESPETELPKVKIDVDKIREVIMNLIDNAIKYTKHGQVKVKLALDGKNILFSVVDNGIGIKKDDMDNLFKKFSRSNNGVAVNVEGTGLGLYVAKQMIDYHQGKIWAASAGEGQGSTFSFTLPVVR